MSPAQSGTPFPTDDAAIALTRDGRGVVTLALDRPEIRNAFDSGVVDSMTQALGQLASDPSVRLLILTGNGTAFCAGADIAWMRELANQSDEENLADAHRMKQLFEAIETFPRVVVARVNGPALGGGAAMVACADLAIATEEAVFAFSEVRLGLVPAVVAPFVLRKLGHSAARELMLSGTRIAADTACHMRLVTEVVAADHLDARIDGLVSELLQSSPRAQAATKQLLRQLVDSDYTRKNDDAMRIGAASRTTDAAREGMSAFLERRRPNWAH